MGGKRFESPDKLLWGSRRTPRGQLHIVELTIRILAESHYSIKTKLCRVIRSLALMAPFVSEI